MSRHHSSTAHEVQHIISEANRMSKEEVEQLHGIELMDNGEVFDPMFNLKFATLGEWAQFSVEQDEVEYEEHFHHDEGYFD